MWLVRFALRRPVTVVVMVVAFALASWLAIQRMKADIFPAVGAPIVYVAQTYGGMDASQMEGYMTYYYEYHFLYITGIEHVESRNVQGTALMKLVFHPDTDMSQAMAEVVGYVTRARAFMPPGAPTPFIMRFDAGSVAVAQLVFSSPNKSPSEMQDIALNRVRPIFATLPGVSAPPPFGGNQRSIVIRVDPSRLRQYQLSPDDVIAAVNKATTVSPSGNLRTGDLLRVATANTALGADLSELLETPLHSGAGPTVYLGDVGTIADSSDILTGYAHVNGRRTVYIPVTKRADASTLDVIRRVKDALPRMRAAAGADVTIDLVFDQSGFVLNALRALVSEGLIGAALTGLAVLLFLRDWRSSLIVVTTIPFALLGAVTGLWAIGQTINIMTLGGLALAVGMLVDESTVAIESIHTHLAQGLTRSRAVLEAARKTAVPRLLAMLCVVAVFLPAFLMTGVGRQLFLPLSLSVGLAMLASYLLSSTLVPVLALWLSGGRHLSRRPEGRFYARCVEAAVRFRWLVTLAYLALCALLTTALYPRIGTEIFPRLDAGLIRIRLRAPAGTRVERTELAAVKAVETIKQALGNENVLISSAFIGAQGSSYPINTIHLWTSGSHEAVLTVSIRGAGQRDVLRNRLRQALPGVSISFEAADIVSQVMSFGSPTPIEVAVQSPRLAASRAYAEKIRVQLAKIPALRDLQYAQTLDAPSVNIKLDRGRAGQRNVTAASIAKSLTPATSSTRFTDPNYWRDPRSGNAFQIQLEIPQSEMASLADLRGLPVRADTLLEDVAGVDYSSTAGQVDRYNMQRVVSLTANLEGESLGPALQQIRGAIGQAGAHDADVSVNLRGQAPALEETLSGLGRGLWLAIGLIFLLLAAYFQSLRLSLVAISPIPAAVCGSLAALWLTGTTLNVESFMGAIMSIGISVANAILLINFAEMARRDGAGASAAAQEGARGRLRPILMTASAMLAGMIPLAFAASDQAATAPLGRAVIGGLALATVATLTVTPALYAVAQGRAHGGASLDPDDPESRFYEDA